MVTSGDEDVDGLLDLGERGLMARLAEEEGRVRKHQSGSRGEDLGRERVEKHPKALDLRADGHLLGDRLEGACSSLGIGARKEVTGRLGRVVGDEPRGAGATMDGRLLSLEQVFPEPLQKQLAK